VIADDHANVHPLLRRILESEFRVVECVLDGRALVEAVDRVKPDLIVVDVVMPVLDGIQAVKQLRARSNHVRVIFISTDCGEHSVRNAWACGAQGFVRKASAAEDLLPAARAVLRGEQFLSSGIGRGLAL
jgi:DNA-binding NarL/FixJ family response regulator